jgi:hypothetical protein
MIMERPSRRVQIVLKKRDQVTLPPDSRST